MHGFSFLGHRGFGRSFVQDRHPKPAPTSTGQMQSHDPQGPSKFTNPGNGIATNLFSKTLVRIVIYIKIHATW